MKIKIPINFKKINYFKLLPLLLLLIIILILLFIANFLNNNYFQTQKNINKINQLSNLVTPVIVEINTYNKILENLEKKHQPQTLDLSQLKNPFQDVIKESVR